MRIQLMGLLIATLFFLAGCTTQREAAAFQERDVHRVIDEQRICDANSKSENPSVWLKTSCTGRDLPTQCEKPGTDDLPVCHRWGLAQIGALQAFAASNAQLNENVLISTYGLH